MDNKLKRAPGIYLTGFMGSGKTTVARALADRLGWDFVDLDAEIEAAEHDTIAHIFEPRGEPNSGASRPKCSETDAQAIERGYAVVVALGGGTFVQPEVDCWRTTEFRSGWIVRSKRWKRGLRTDATRPLARDREAFRQLYEERRAAYGRADLRDRCRL